MAAAPDFRTLFEALPGLFVVFDADSTIVAATDAYLLAAMRQRADIVGRNVFEVFPDNPDDPAATGVANIRRSLEVVRREKVADTMPVVKYDIQRPESEGGGYEVRYWSSKNSPVLGPDGGVAYIIQRVEDITEYVLLEEKRIAQQQIAENLKERTNQMQLEIIQRSQDLQKLNGELMAANKAKSIFLANMSHELRTPLNAILGFSELLIDDTAGHFTDDSRKRFLANIHNSGSHLLGLINDILDLSKVEAGEMDLHRETLEVGSAIADVVATLGPQAESQQIKVTVDAAGGGKIEADPRKLKQMLLNLASNAIKFTPAGGQVSITATRLASSIEISVADTGIGIAKSDQSQLFQEFKQLDSGHGRKLGGTGLGLALTRRLAQLHGGDVTLESEAGRGSVFTIHLPLAQPEAKAAIGAEGQGAGPLILVVDDNAAAAELMRATLQKGGYRTEVATTGIEALAKARQLQPAAITLDIVLPQLDGWEVLAQLKRGDTTSHIPVLVASFIDKPELGRALGAFDYLVKPIDPRELLKRLGQFTASHGRDALSVLVVDDESANRDLLAGILQPAGFAVRLATGGREGITAAKADHPDLILLDLMMPDVTGFEVVESIRADPDTSEIPIMVITARDLTEADKEQLNGQVSTILNRGSTGAADLLGHLNRVTHKAS